MRIGYPCLNHSLTHISHKSFQLKSYSQERLISIISNNLKLIQEILNYNVKNHLLFFRISSGTVPFASHSICEFDWLQFFSKELAEVGHYIQAHHIRISMHPDQFVLINALDEKIVTRSIAELNYHCDLLDAMGLNQTAKVQIHVGGMYGDKPKAIERFIKNYEKLPAMIQKRLVIENDDRLFDLQDCLKIHQHTGIPIIFDNFHHACLNQGEKLTEALSMASNTWSVKDGINMVDYSSQEPGGRLGKHISAINIADFKKFIKTTLPFDFDIMLEIKDKEISALKALKVIEQTRKGG